MEASRRYLPTHTRLFIAISLAPTALFAAGQDPELESLLDLSLEELMQIDVRSATKVSQPLRDIPASVSILTREDIANYGYATLTEVLRNVPGLYIEEDTEEIYLGTRGAINASIQLLVNGIPQNRAVQRGLSTVEANRMNIPVGAIDRIEFIRGPMSVIYGNNAFAGTLNIITNQRDGEAVRVAYGSNDNGEAFASTGRTFENAGYHLNIGSSRQGSFTGDYDDMLGAGQLPQPPDTKTTMDGHMDRELESLDFSGHWRGLSTTLRYQKSEYPIYPTLPPTLAGDTELTLESTQFSLQYDTALSEAWHSRTIGIIAHDEYDIPAFNFLTTALTGNQNQESDHLEFEQNLIFQPDDINTVLLGYRFAREQGIHNNASTALGPLTLIELHQTSTPENTHDAFANYRRVVMDGLEAELGVRYSRLPGNYRQDIEGLLPRTEFANTDDRNQWNYHAALQYELDNINQLKLLYGTASQESKGSSSTEPEAIRTTELVHVLTTDRWLLTQSLFYSQSKNLARRTIEFDPGTSSFVNITTNDGRLTTTGYEVAVDFRPTESWRLGASYSLQSTDDERSDLDVGYSPAQLAKLKTDYRFGRSTLALYTHFVDARESDWNFVDTNGDGQPDTPVRIGERADAYWNTGANWRYEFAPNMATGLNVSNLFDEDYRYPANEVSDLDRGLIAVGRVVTLSLDASF